MKELKEMVGEMEPMVDRLVVRCEKRGELMVGGIHLPETQEDTNCRLAEVIAVGPGGMDEEGVRREVLLKAGDMVVIPAYVGFFLDPADRTLRIIRGKEVLVRVKKA